MESKLLTTEIAGAYFGCKVAQNISGSGSFLLGTMINVSEHSIVIDLDYKYGNYKTSSYNIELCHLILTPLSEITDEHIHGCYKAMGTGGFEDDFSKEHFIETISPNEVAGHKDRYGQSCYYRAIDYLRSVGYDCGHGSIPSLIEAGIAIKAEKK